MVDADNAKEFTEPADSENYVNCEKIGNGGFGTVFRCTRIVDNQSVAKKVLDEKDSDSDERFSREVRILSKLDHPNIVKVLDKHLTSSPKFFVMPLFDGSLYSHLSKVVGNEARIQNIFSAILDAIEYAHAQNIIHRDLKPENVLLNIDADVVVSDFGLGRSVDRKTTRLTKTTTRLGTDYYMAPEQSIGLKNADKRSDVYSLGMMLYELYVGELTSMVIDLTELPPTIRILVDKCLKKNPEERFQSVTELKNAWKAVWEPVDLANEIKTIKNICTQVSVSHQINDAQIELLTFLLSKHLKETDLIHDSLMMLGPSVVAILFEANTGAMATIVRTFIRAVMAQSWPYNYTDKISDFCSQLYYLIGDHSIRAALICCIAEVGLSHNRFKVIGKFKEMISQMQDAGECIALSQELKALTPNVVSNSFQLLISNKSLPVGVRRAFESILLGVSEFGPALPQDAQLKWQKTKEQNYLEMMVLGSTIDSIDKIEQISKTVFLHVSVDVSEHVRQAQHAIAELWLQANNEKVLLQTVNTAPLNY